MDHRDGRDNLPVLQQGRFQLVEGGRSWVPTSSAAPAEDEGIDIRRILDLLWRKKWWIVLATVLGVGAGYFLKDTVPEEYQARGTVWVATRDQQGGPIQGPEVLRGQGWTDLFQSRAVLEPVVRNERLFLKLPDSERSDADLFSSFGVADDARDGDYTFAVDSGSRYELRDQDGTVLERGELGDSVGLGLGFRWRPEPGAVRPGQAVSFSVYSPAGAVQQLRNNLVVSFNSQTGNLITTRFGWEDRTHAAEILNSILDSFLNVAGDLQTQKLREKVNILKQQTNYAANRLDSAELALERTRVANITLPSEPQTYPVPAGGQSVATSQPVQQDPVFQHYFEQKVSASELASQISQLQGILGKLRSGGDVDVTDLQMIPAVDSSSTLSRTLSTLTDKMAQRRSLLLQYTEEHPAVKDVTREIQDIKTRALPGQIAGLIGQLQTRLSSVQGDLAAQADELRRIPPRTIQEARLRRDMQMAEQLHNDLLVRLKEAELAASTNMPDLQIVDRAAPAESPSSNQGARFFLMASMAGLGLGLGGVLLFDRFDQRFRFPEQVGRQLGLPVLGIIPRIRGAAGTEPATAQSVIEAFRVIRNQLGRMRTEWPTVIVVTSPTPRDGKTLISANLAISFAGAGKKTLLMDGDLRRGDADRLFALSPTPGLADLLTRGTAMERVVRSTELQGLSFMGHGKLSNFDPVLLEGERFDRVMELLRDSFDVIVVDAPPLVAGSDPLLLGERADQVVLVLRTGETDMSVARTRLEALGAFDIPLAGVVLNDVPDRALYQKYYSSYRYYVEGEVVA